MKKVTLTLVTAIFIIMTSCEKEEIKPSQPDPKDKLIECKKCEAGWDITDPNE